MSQQLRSHHGQVLEVIALCLCWERARGTWLTLSAHPWANLHCWHLKCWFLSTYANCCNFPDEAAIRIPWYNADRFFLTFSIMHSLFSLHFVRAVSAWSGTESLWKLRGNCIRLPTLWKGKLLANLFKPLALFSSAIVLGIHDCLIGDLFYCVVLSGVRESDLYQTNYPPFSPFRSLPH